MYGFLGPNGAGKTTTLRLLLGLLQLQGGEVRLFNKSLAKSRIELLRKTGSLIESPSFYSNLTAAENLLVFQKVYGCPKARIQESLELVGLGKTGNKPAGNFSLGMKQRLSIATALLHQPSLLILDEPTNGLDPNGIIEIRELLRRLNREQGMTILISSHLLAEIERLVTHIGIINKGSLLFQGTLEQLQRKQSQGSVTSWHTNEPGRAMGIFRSYAILPTLVDDQVLIPTAERELIATLNEQLVLNKIEVYQISPVKNDLESIFIDLVKST